ncbi:hypothetical protein [Arsukibacterium sp.]|uniref:hypothetical protein n=1 Tax=Arsukibacterium sp. TaxID=1977258 RepID=UPI003563EB46
MEQSTNQSLSKSAFDRGVDTASDSLHQAIDSASGAAGPAIKQMTNSAHDTVNSMAGGAHYAAAAISHKGEQLHNLQQQLTKNTRSQVRSHPLMAIGIALAGGVLLSWWFSRSSRRDES